MSLWFLSIPCNSHGKGEATNLLAKVERIIEVGNFRKIIPQVCVGLLLDRGRNYYLFVGFDASLNSKGHVPREIYDVFNTYARLPLTGTPVSYESVRDIIRREGERLVYRSPAPVAVIPRYRELRDAELRDPLAEQERKRRGNASNRLLFWLSAAGDGSWGQFAAVVASLVPGEKEKPSNVLRRLRLLGHMETDAEREHWCVALAVLNHCVIDKKRAYCLCGRRDARLIATLREHGTVLETEQPEGNGPSRLLFQPDDPGERAFLQSDGIADRVVCVEDAAMQLAQALPTLDDWKASLPQSQTCDTYLYEIRQFDGIEFQTVPFTGKTGFYELYPVSSGGETGPRPVIVTFYDATERRWYQGDWYGLRFLTQCAEVKSCRVIHDVTRERLYVPLNWRWPELYERALVLASGLLPDQVDDLLVYTSIQTDLLDVLKTKLPLDILTENDNLCIVHTQSSVDSVDPVAVENPVESETESCTTL